MKFKVGDKVRIKTMEELIASGKFYKDYRIYHKELDISWPHEPFLEEHTNQTVVSTSTRFGGDIDVYSVQPFEGKYSRIVVGEMLQKVDFTEEEIDEEVGRLNFLD